MAIYNYRLDDPDGDDDTADSKVASHFEQYLRETVVIAAFSSDKTFLGAGETATLSWTVGDVEILALDNEIGDVLPITTDGSGSIEVMPTVTTTYILSGEGPAGDEMAEVTIEVNSPPTIDSFAGSAAALIKGQAITLTWATTNAASVTIEPGIGEVESSGTREVIVTENVTFTLTATNDNATLTSEISVEAKDGDPNLVAHWRIGEAPGETDGAVIISEVNSGQNATFADLPPEWTRSDLPPISSTAALELDGTMFADAETYTGVTGAQDRTISFWLKGDDIQNPNATLVSWGGTAITSRWGIRVGGSLNIRTEVAGSGSEGSALIIDGEWHHVAVVFANDDTPNIEDIVFYVDGVVDDLSVIGNTEINTSDANTVRVGASRTLANRGFTGLLDDIRIYDKALTVEEIEDVMNNGGGPGNPFAVTAVGYDGTKTSLTWNSTPGQTFGIDSTTTLQNWIEIDDGVDAGDGSTTTYEVTEPGFSESYFRVRLEP